MAAEFFYGIISALQYPKGTADVTIPDRQSIVVPAVPFLAEFYNMPKVGDQVACIFNDEGGRLDKGVVLGKVYSDAEKPHHSGADVFNMPLPDGSSLDCACGTFTINAKNIVLNGEVQGTADIRAVGTSLKHHTHPGVHGETGQPSQQ